MAIMVVGDGGIDGDRGGCSGGMVIMVVGSDGTDGDHITVVGSGGMVVMVL